MTKKIFTVAITLILSAAMQVNAQTPYSIYGLGTLDDNTLGVNSGM